MLDICCDVTKLLAAEFSALVKMSGCPQDGTY